MWRELPPHTRTWSEQDWEEFFEEQDRLHRDAVHDGCWLPEADQTASSAMPIEPPTLDDTPPQEPLEELHWGEEELEAEERLDDELGDIPAWCSAADFSDRVYEYVTPACRRQIGGPRDFILHMLCQQSFLVQDYLAAGHEMGYDEDTLCGNIALCSRALKSLDRCVQGLERVVAQDDICRNLLLRAQITRGFMMRRIEDLRALVWWQ